ncbi:PBP1A family penicillin-binding protein [bacterium]|nr:PBP1A family penicillin-binding protein [bacterium]
MIKKKRKNKTWEKRPITKSPKKVPVLRKRKTRTWKRRSLNSKKKIKSSHKLGRKILIVTLFLFLLSGTLVAVVFAWVNHNLPQPDKLFQREIAQSTKIYDRTGKVVLYEIFANEKRTMIDLSEIPQNLIYATIVVEDKDFFQHSGFNLQAILRSIIIDILQGGKVQGGSTLTQQFVKNAFLTSEKTYIRKIKELLLAYQIEKKFSKKEILQMYFNEIPYGSNAYGIEAASQIYFNKSARNLTLDESALLAAITKAPTYYSPYGNNREELIQRRNFILKTMAIEGYITNELSKQAQNIDTLKKIVLRRENIIAPHFVMYVKKQLIEKYGQRQVEQGGLKVITSLDVNQQDIAEKIITQRAERNEKIFNASNAALVSINVKTGEILSWVGSKNFFNQEIDGQVNIVTSNRQPGSSFKPIVYAAAFEKGFTPETVLFDVETNFGPAGKKDYIPKNYNEEYHGPVTMRQALAGSLNIPGVKTLYLTGIKNTINLAQRMGYTTLIDPDRYGLSLVLGGGEVKLLEHTAAFGIFAREGKKIPTTCILKVENNQGKILEETNTQFIESQQVMSVQTARQINDILSDNQARIYVFGEKNSLALPDRPVAAKTGTTNNARDAWIIGYTPDLVVGVWVGNNDNQAMTDKADGATLAAPIWNEFMEKVLINTPVKKFNMPEAIQVDKPILNGKIPEDTITLKIDKASQKLATELTPISFIEEKTFQNYYSILNYVDKDNPRGPAPSNPSLDPQYNRWQEGIAKWLNENPKQAGAVPTEYDDLHIPANEPFLTILSPSNGQEINQQILGIEIKTSSTRGVKKIKCSIDNITLNIIEIKEENGGQEEKRKCEINLSGLKAGTHKIKVSAFDDIDNHKSQEVWIKTLTSFDKKIIWITPQSNQIIRQTNFPFNVSILVPVLKIQKIKFFNQQEDNKINLLGTIFTPESAGLINFSWPMADVGAHKIWAEIVDINGETLITNKIQIEIK